MLCCLDSASARSLSCCATTACCADACCFSLGVISCCAAPSDPLLLPLPAWTCDPSLCSELGSGPTYLQGSEAAKKGGAQCSPSPHCRTGMKTAQDLATRWSALACMRWLKR